MILNRVVKFLILGMTGVFVFIIIKTEDPMHCFYWGGIYLFLQMIQKGISYSVFKKNVKNIILLKTRKNNIKRIVLILFGAMLSLVYWYKPFIINDVIDALISVSGMLLLVEYIINNRQDLVITEEIIGARYLNSFIKWHKINQFKIDKNNLKLWSTFREVEIPVDRISQEDRGVVINELNQNLENVFKGKLVYQEDKIKII